MLSTWFREATKIGRQFGNRHTVSVASTVFSETGPTPSSAGGGFRDLGRTKLQRIGSDD